MPPETQFAVVARTGAFDFTPAFEDAVLGIVPSALFLVVALQRLFWLARQPRKVAKSHRPIVKVARDKLCPETIDVFWVHCVRKKKQLLTGSITAGIDRRIHSFTTCSLGVLGSEC
jgi:hypothetical protein